ncbi:MAG: hypothetical protein H6916_04020 [Novosphingobium sp.]|uniref:hypothetical protein n=1 Tax=Novosphingobium sp. TaxID=1874826 RepID=UPI002616FF87|nr:hypothetical protein [Novosphingobium sp.]MCP5385968.1 hypothetical protein [Novosphingobium sp.]
MTRLTPAMIMLVKASWDRCDPRQRSGYGVELIGSAAWQTARRLAGEDLGWIEGGQPQGSELPGLFFATRDAAALIGLFDEDGSEEA